jgi:hypothetical protein
MALRSNVARLRDMLLKARLVDELQMKAAMGRLQQWGGRLPGVLVDMGFCDDEKMVNTLAQLMRLPTMHLGMVQRDDSLLRKVGVEFCEEHGVFPVSLANRVATVAFSDPTEIDTIDALAARLNVRVQVVIASENEVRAAIAKHYRNQVLPAARAKAPQGEDFTPEPTAPDRVPGNPGAGLTSPRQQQEAVFEFDAEAPPSPREAAPSKAPAGWLARPPSANTMLDDFLDDEPGKTDGLNAEELKRLEAAKANQAKAGAILRALQQLLAEKGYLR